MKNKCVWLALCGLLALSASAWAEEPSNVRPVSLYAESIQSVSSSRHSCGPEYRGAGASPFGSKCLALRDFSSASISM